MHRSAEDIKSAPSFPQQQRPLEIRLSDNTPTKHEEANCDRIAVAHQIDLEAIFFQDIP